MSLKMFKELLNGKYDAISPPTLLPTGSIVGGKNIRKIGQAGGWKVRKGTSLHNTTQISAHEVNSLHAYTHPRSLDAHFLAQINSLIYDATNVPPAGGTTFGVSLGVVSELTPAFSDIVHELFFLADGGGAPFSWGGDSPFCMGFITYIGDDAIYSDYTRKVTDNRGDTYAVLHDHVDDVLYICSPEPADKISLVLVSGTENDAATVLTVNAWTSGSWSDVSAADGTDVAGDSMKQSGDITWTEPVSEGMRVVEGIMGYWYQLVWTVALDAGVQVSKCNVHYGMARLTNKWNGVYEWAGAVRYFDNTQYQDFTGQVTNESTSVYMDVGLMATTDYIYMKAAEPATGIGIGVVAEYENAVGGGNVDLIEYWNGLAWTTCGTLDDGTAVGGNSFAQTGTIWWNLATQSDERRTFDWDSIPGFWYRISIDAASTTEDIRLWGVNYAPLPEPLATTNGVIEFKGRLLTWGDPEYPNRLRFSAKDRPDCFSGTDSGYTEQFGEMDPILCARRFYNELMVWKKNEVYLLEGYSPETFGALRVSTTVGLASPQTAWVVETGSPTMHKNEPLSIAIWQEVDGIYILDGRKPRKISEPIDQYFNPEYSDCIAANKIRNRQAFLDKSNNEYHLILPEGELVYNYLTDEWYPAWEREVDLTCGLLFRGTDNRHYTYGGNATGFIFRLENGSVDKDVANTNQDIVSSIKTRAISAEQDKSTTLKETFRKSWIEAKALDASSAIVTKIYPDVAETGTVITTPVAMNLQRANYDLVTPTIEDSIENISCFQMEWLATGLDFQIYSFLYQVDARGELIVV